MLSWVKFGPQLETIVPTKRHGCNMHTISSLTRENIYCIDIQQHVDGQEGEDSDLWRSAVVKL